MHNTGIYAIRNVTNDKRYIGSASSLKAREREHFRSLGRGRHHSIALQRAWNMYGAEAFVFERILYCDRHNLLMYEQALIDGLRPEYNIAPVAGSQLGYRHTDQTRQKMSVARRRNPSSPRKGMTHTDEAKRKISVAKRGVKLGPYSKGRIENAAHGMRASHATVNEDQVRQIRAMKAEGLAAWRIAEAIGCKKNVVDDISRGRTWTWVV